MSSLAGGILVDHPTALLSGQIVMAVVAVLSFYWAYEITKPIKKRDINDLRSNKVEDVAGLKAICNPGRRSTDRCSVCPLDDRCLKKLPPLDPAEAIRDNATTLALAAKLAASKPRPSVLFVDDNEPLGIITQALLEQAGIRCRIATSMDEALPIRALENVLVTDWRLGKETGDKMIAAFRAASPGKPVVVVSALEQPVEGMPPFVTWVTKPFEADAFISLVQNLLKG